MGYLLLSVKISAAKLAGVVAVALLCASCATTQIAPVPAPENVLPPGVSTERSREQTVELFDALLQQYTSSTAGAGESERAARQQISLLASLDPLQLDARRRTELIFILFQRGLAQHQLVAIAGLRQHPLWWQWRSALSPAEQRRLDLFEARYLIAVGELDDGLQLLLDDSDNLDLARANTVWNTLNSCSTDTLQQLETEASLKLRQLASLALALRISEGNYSAQEQKLDRWLVSHSRHPLAEQLPDYFSALQRSTTDLASIAVVLSHDQSSAAASRALTEGLLAHYYQLGRNQPLPPLQFFTLADDGTYTELYRQLRAQGVSRVIGPLRRSQLDQLFEELLSEQVQEETAEPTLAELTPPRPVKEHTLAGNLLPTLALNESSRPLPEELSEHTEIEQLPLSVEHELLQILNRASARNAHRILLIAPNAGWGARGARWLQSAWQLRDGEIEVSYYSASERDFTPLLQGPLALTDSRQRSRDLQRLTGLSLESRPRRRQDIDLVVLLAQPEQGRQIRPALDFNFANDLPVFATSHIYPGDTRYNRDLAGIEFPASNWQLSPLQPNSESANIDPTLARQLAALGADALTATLRQAQLGNVETPLFASSGILVAGPAGYQRSGLWHKISDSGALPINAAKLDHQTAQGSARTSR